jgi:hypothetical protein
MNNSNTSNEFIRRVINLMSKEQLIDYALSLNEDIDKLIEANENK